MPFIFCALFLFGDGACTACPPGYVLSCRTKPQNPTRKVTQTILLIFTRLPISMDQHKYCPELVTGDNATEHFIKTEWNQDLKTSNISDGAEETTSIHATGCCSPHPATRNMINGSGRCGHCEHLYLGKLKSKLKRKQPELPGQALERVQEKLKKVTEHSAKKSGQLRWYKQRNKTLQKKLAALKKTNRGMAPCCWDLAATQLAKGARRNQKR